MGNEGSLYSGLDVSNEVLEVTNSWILKQSIGITSPPLSVFISHENGLAVLEKSAKKLKLYRHPGILKYVDSWKHGSSLYLATEQVTPLVQVLPNLKPLQICLGLRSVLRAIVFLHETALASHNNVCIASVYVTNDGTWKLGNFEFLCSHRDLTSALLRENKAERYEPAICPSEEQGIKVPSCVDAFAFGRLVQEILKNVDSSGELGETALGFLNIATTQLQNANQEARGNLSSLLDHSYFAHPVVAILEFLSELTLKSADDKEQFFRSLWAQLATLPEEMVATQLSDLLLSRLVLLESSAQQQFLPWLLAIRDPDNDSGSIPNGECMPIFSKPVFEKFVAPKLAKIFQVRDSQVRSVLLRHFSSYCHAFTRHQLQYEILPELLLGIKDESDSLVADTLRALADLVPLLGATTVIGGKRGKLFTDGRPKVRQPRPSLKLGTTAKAAASPVKVKCDETNDQLPERLSPDGGEAWSDWDDQDTTESPSLPQSPALVIPEPSVKLPDPTNIKSEMKVQPLRVISDDLDALDIKAAKITAPPLTKEVDFFQDMEPVISSARTLSLTEESKAESSTMEVDKFKVESSTMEEDGWGDEEFSDWDDTKIVS